MVNLDMQEVFFNVECKVSFFDFVVEHWMLWTSLLFLAVMAVMYNYERHRHGGTHGELVRSKALIVGLKRDLEAAKADVEGHVKRVEAACEERLSKALGEAKGLVETWKSKHRRLARELRDLKKDKEGAVEKVEKVIKDMPEKTRAKLAKASDDHKGAVG